MSSPSPSLSSAQAWRQALTQRATVWRLIWIIARVTLALLCAQRGAQFIYQGF